MKRIALAVCVAVLVFGAAILAQTQTESVEQELLKLEQEGTNAIIKGDVAFLDRILAEDWMVTDSDGVLTTKAQSLAAIKSSETIISSMVADDMKVRIYGDAAVVTGRNTVKSMREGKDISGQERWTDTWIKYDGRWKCVATHSSKIPQK
jgi:ketosteroid isomerase-like protein